MAFRTSCYWQILCIICVSISIFFSPPCSLLSWFTSFADFSSTPCSLIGRAPHRSEVMDFSSLHPVTFHVTISHGFKYPGVSLIHTPISDLCPKRQIVLSTCLLDISAGTSLPSSVQTWPPELPQLCSLQSSTSQLRAVPSFLELGWLSCFQNIQHIFKIHSILHYLCVFLKEWKKKDNKFERLHGFQNSLEMEENSVWRPWPDIPDLLLWPDPVLVSSFLTGIEAHRYLCCFGGQDQHCLRAFPRVVPSV